jgi:hypothetical protein
MQYGNIGCQKPQRRRAKRAFTSDASRSPRFQPMMGERQFDWNRSSDPGGSIKKPMYTLKSNLGFNVRARYRLAKQGHTLVFLDQCVRFGACLFEEGENYVKVGEGNARKDEETVLCGNCGTSYPVPRSTRRTGVFYRILSKRRQLSVQRVAPRNWRSQFVIERRKY